MQSPIRAILAGPTRTVAIVSAVVSGIVVTALGVRFAGTSSPSRIDQRASHDLTGLRLNRQFVQQVADLGGPAHFAIIIVVTVAILAALRQWRLAVLALVGPALAAGITELPLKHLFDRRLGEALSYPSAHSTAVFAIAVVLILAWVDLAPRRLRRITTTVVIVAAIAVSAAVAAALVITDRHYFTDTVGGAAVAVVIVVAAAFVIDACARPLTGATTGSATASTGTVAAEDPLPTGARR